MYYWKILGILFLRVVLQSAIYCLLTSFLLLNRKLFFLKPFSIFYFIFFSFSLLLSFFFQFFSFLLTLFYRLQILPFSSLSSVDSFYFSFILILLLIIYVLGKWMLQIKINQIITLFFIVVSFYVSDPKPSFLVCSAIHECSLIKRITRGLSLIFLPSLYTARFNMSKPGF